MAKIKAFDKILKLYDYNLPPELIAQSPAKPRDAARLLVYKKNSKKISFDIFSNMADFLPKNSVLVFNQTKVWPARMIVKKETGGKVELLYISHDESYIKILCNKNLVLSSLLYIPSQPPLILRGGEKQLPPLKIRGGKGVIFFRVTKKLNQFYFLKPSFPLSQIPKILKQYGVTPLPPYIKKSPLTEPERRKEYQSVFAKTGLSVAAPTASLHFTKRLISQLQKQGIGIAFVQLDVNLGTFAPLREEQIKSGKLHQEFYYIDKSTAKFLNQAKKEGRPIIAVGTTVVRTLESATTSFCHSGQAADGGASRNLKYHKLTKLSGQTDLFIKENYKFKFVDGLITNFHVPKSSLLMLTSAFAGRKKLLDLYQRAISKNFRFFSFGDGMLILS